MSVYIRASRFPSPDSTDLVEVRCSQCGSRHLVREKAALTAASEPKPGRWLSAALTWLVILGAMLWFAWGFVWVQL